MRVSIQKGFKVNTGNYEHVEVSAHITLGEEDFEPEELEGLDRDERMALVQREARRYAADYLEPELKQLAPLSHPDSMLAQTKTPTAPARRERTTRRRSTS